MEYFIKAHPAVFREMRMGITDWQQSKTEVTEEEIEKGVAGYLRIPLIEDQEMDPESIIINLKNRMVIEKF